MDYQTQQLKLFPLVATCFMQGCAAIFVHDEYEKMMEQVKNDNFEKMDILHHLTSGFKSLHTQQAYDGIIQVRQSIGGAGYSAWSGIP